MSDFAFVSEKLAPLVREISWSNNGVIMGKCKDDLQREFYIQMTKRYGWTKHILTNFIEASVSCRTDCYRLWRSLLTALVAVSKSLSLSCHFSRVRLYPPKRAKAVAPRV